MWTDRFGSIGAVPVKAAHRKEAFAISRNLRENYHRLSKLICDAGTDEKETHPGSGLYGINENYPSEWEEAFSCLDLAIQEMNLSVGRNRHA